MQAGTTAKRPAAPLVRDEEARATRAKQQRLKQSVGTVQPQVTGMVANTPPSLCKTAPSGGALRLRDDR
jgi:hypothetical protein